MLSSEYATILLSFGHLRKIAMTNEFETMLAIKHDAQIAYEKA